MASRSGQVETGALADPKEAKPSRPVYSMSSNLSKSNTSEAEKPTAPKKIPPIKAPVGLAKGPDLKNCKSKVGSLNNIKHTPTSSGIAIQSQKLKWNAKSKVGSMENKAHKPGGGNRKVETQKLEWKTTSKVQSLQNVNHKPGGGNVRIFNESYGDRATNDRRQNTSPGEEMGPDLTLLQENNKTNTSVNHNSIEKSLKDLKI